MGKTKASEDGHTAGVASRPPRLARWLLRRYVRAGAARDGLLGDLEELRARRLATGRAPAAVRRLAADVGFVREAFTASLLYRRSARDTIHFTADGQGRRHDPFGPVREVASAARQLARTPGFAAASILTLTLGIGATTAIFAVLQAVLLAPLPFPDAERLVVIEHRLPGYPSDGGEVVFGAFQGQLLQYIERSRELVEIGAYGTFDAAITGAESPEYAHFAYATAGFFRALDIEPLYGRLFDDDEPDPVEVGRGATILSRALATQRYGGAPSLVGELIETEGFEYEVVGVLPNRLAFPPQAVQIWHPRSERTLRANPVWTVDTLVGRMAPGATPASLQRELAGLVAEIPERFPGSAIQTVAENGRMAPLVTPMKDWLVGDVGPALWLLLAAVVAVMGIACVNVANLLLVRTDSRRHELAVRVALGASRWRLARYFLAESAVLAGGAGLLGAVAAFVAIDALQGSVLSRMPRFTEVDAGWGVVVPAVVLSSASVALFALVPLLSRGWPGADVLRGGGRGATAGRHQLRARHVMVGVQLAMAVALLIGSGLILRSFHALTAVDPGFEAEGVLTFRLPFPYQEIQASDAPEGRATPFYDELVDRLVALPGVVSAGYGVCLPLAEVCELDGYPVKPEGLADSEVAEQPLAGLQPTAPGFLESLRIPVLAGRGLERSDHELRTNAVLVSAGLAQRLWPGADALGKRLEQGGGSAAQNFHFTVVGVVGDIRFDALRSEPEWIVYTPVRFQERGSELWAASFVVRAEVPPLSLVPQVRELVAGLRNDVPVADIAAMDTVVERSTADVRLAMTMLMAAAAAALAMSATGVYGVVSYVVSLRRGEFGIRMALGAEGGQLRAQVLREGVTTLLGGLVAGVAAAAATSRVLGSVLYEVAPTDPLTYSLVAVFLVATTWLAAYVPAHRASRVSPAEVLQR